MQCTDSINWVDTYDCTTPPKIAIQPINAANREHHSTRNHTMQLSLQPNPTRKSLTFTAFAAARVTKPAKSNAQLSQDRTNNEQRKTRTRDTCHRRKDRKGRKESFFTPKKIRKLLIFWNSCPTFNIRSAFKRKRECFDIAQRHGSCTSRCAGKCLPTPHSDAPFIESH